VIHPFSAALSVVFGLHHCVANCIVLNALGEFYPDAFVEFRKMVELQQVALPQGVCANLTDELRSALIAATIKHEKPLTNALGADFRKTLTDSRIISLFEKM
jgi:3-deoxy-alpha-D-manno-octulosonate 8-oxidase